jgi:hypothetical protein
VGGPGDKMLGWKGGTCAAINAIVNRRVGLFHYSLWKVSHALARYSTFAMSSEIVVPTRRAYDAAGSRRKA